jgi:hypothetical protein
MECVNKKNKEEKVYTKYLEKIRSYGDDYGFIIDKKTDKLHRLCKEDFFKIHVLDVILEETEEVLAEDPDVDLGKELKRRGFFEKDLAKYRDDDDYSEIFEKLDELKHKSSIFKNAKLFREHGVDNSPFVFKQNGIDLKDSYKIEERLLKMGKLPDPLLLDEDDKIRKVIEIKRGHELVMEEMGLEFRG